MVLPFTCAHSWHHNTVLYWLQLEAMCCFTGADMICIKGVDDKFVNIVISDLDDDVIRDLGGSVMS